jgi:hypothetical protein
VGKKIKDTNGCLETYSIQLLLIVIINNYIILFTSGVLILLYDLSLSSLPFPEKQNLVADDGKGIVHSDFLPPELSPSECLLNIIPLEKRRIYKGIVQAKRGDSHLNSLTSIVLTTVGSMIAHEADYARLCRYLLKEAGGDVFSLKGCAQG